MSLFLFKLILTPSLLTFIGWLQKRFGHRLSGIFSGLPVNVGPITVFLALEQGQAYVRDEAGTLVLNMACSMLFLVSYLELSKKHSWPICLAVSLLIYGVTGYVMSSLMLPTGVEFALGLLAPLGVLAYLKKQTDWETVTSAGKKTLLWRAITGVVFLVGVTMLANYLPPKLVALLAITPIFLSILLGFSHFEYGRSVLNSLVFGSLIGIYGTTAFLAVLAFAPVSWPGWADFMLAFAAAILIAFALDAFSKKLRFKTVA